ncbi:MAG: hypothetical protein HY318_01235 [Armatimonadetes bacterium]|nr:hypothetical protein [Armatimonadota bacterium]
MSYESIGYYQPTSTWPSTRNGLSCIETGLIPITEINRTRKTVISESAQVFRFDTTRTTSEAEQFRCIQELFEKGERDLAFSTMDELLDVMATPSNYLRALRILLRQGEAYTARLLAVKAHQRFPSNARIAKIYKVLRPPTARYTTGKAIDRSREIQWLREHREEYKGQWVVLSGDRLVAASEDLSEALEEAKNDKLEERPLLHQVS